MSEESTMEKKIIRAVAYARVSTKKSEQKNSLENQRAHFQRILSEKEGYTLVSLPTNDGGIYADKGYSGTKLSRPKFDKMLYDAGLRRIIDDTTGKPAPEYSFRIECPPKFDVIFVRDASRFARDTKVIPILQTLLNNGVSVYFESIDKTTSISDDWTYIQIFFNFAESESRQRSEKVKAGYAEGVRKGRVYAGSIPLGYDYLPINENNPLEGNRLVANDKAIVIKTIFDLYDEGLGSKHIEKRLENLGYTTASGGHIDRSVIRYILQNEKYTGTNNAGRFTHGDLFNKKLAPVPYDDATRVAGRKASAKIAKQMAKEGMMQIEPIISKEQFERVQELFHQQSNKFRKKEIYNSYNPYAKKIKCAHCGAYCLVSFSIPKKDKDGKTIVNENGEVVRKRRYQCSNAYQRGKKACPATPFGENVIENLLNSPIYYERELEMIEDLEGSCESCLTILNEALNKDNLEAVKSIDTKIDKLVEERSRLLSLYAKGIYQESELERLTVEYTKQINELSDRRKTLSKTNDEIMEDIQLVKRYILDISKEEKRIKDILKSQKYDVVDRKTKLKDIDYISIDPLGEPTIVFKAYTEMQRVVEFIDHIAEMYIG